MNIPFLEYVFSGAFKIILILVIASVVTKVGEKIISKAVTSFLKKKIIEEETRKERIKTIKEVIDSTFKVAVWVIAILTILPEMGINIGPLLAGLGIAGLALGMGARTIIQDYLSGIFILLEDHYRIGESVMISGTKGKVVELGLRRTVIRDEEKTLHVFPNSQINRSSNFSRKA